MRVHSQVQPFLLFPFLLLSLSACHGNLPLVGAPMQALQPLGPEKLRDSLLIDNDLDIHYYSAKVEVNLRTDSSSKSFKAHVRSVQDSAAWLSIVPALGIEVARVMITTDSLMLMDKLHDTYWIGDSISTFERFGVVLNLDLFQDALLGLPIGLDPDVKYRSDREEDQYVLTSRGKRKFIKAAEDLTTEDSLSRDMKERKMERTLRQAERIEAMVYQYWIDPQTFRVARVTIVDLAHDQQADVRYMERILVDGRSLPALVVLSLSAPGKQITATLKLDRINLNGPLQLSFKIPQKFLPME